MYSIFSHGGEVEMVQSEQVGLISALTHQPTWLSLLVILFVLFGAYSLLEKLKVKPLNRLLVLLPLLILIAIVYLQHNPTVTAVVLSVGFVATFVLAFTLMKGQGKDNKPAEPKDSP